MAPRGLPFILKVPGEKAGPGTRFLTAREKHLVSAVMRVRHCPGTIQSETMTEGTPHFAASWKKRNLYKVVKHRQG